MRALKHFYRLISFWVNWVTTQAHEGIETTRFDNTVWDFCVTTQAREGIETSQDTWRKIKAGGNNSSP